MTVLVLGTIVERSGVLAAPRSGLCFDGRLLYTGSANTLFAYRKLQAIRIESWGGLSTEVHPCFDGRNFWWIDAPNALMYCGHIIGTTMYVIKSFAASGWGVTFDGKHLVTSSGAKDLRWYNPNTGALIRQQIYNVAGGNTFRDVCFDGKYFWVCQDADNLVHCLSPEIGEIDPVASFAFTNPRGIAFDGKYLWIYNASAQRIYCVEKS